MHYPVGYILSMLQLLSKYRLINGELLHFPLKQEILMVPWHLYNQVAVFDSVQDAIRCPTEHQGLLDNFQWW